jgi:hypothetical protein
MYGNSRATIQASMAAATISFDNATSAINDSGSGLITAGFLVGDLVTAFGTTSNNTTFTVTAAVAGALTVTPAPVTEAAGTIKAIVAAAGGQLRDVFRNCVIREYSGSQPANADTTVGTATLLCEYTNNGGAFAHGAAANGLNFDESSGGVIALAATETPKATALATGTAGWIRICANPTDNGLASTTLPRIDMAVGTTSGSDALVATTARTVSKSYYINSGTFTFPYQYGA